MEYPWVRIFIFAAFVVHDGGMAFYYGYLLGENTNVCETFDIFCKKHNLEN